ncbi:nucleotidyltransferase family protein [Aneurinibacillus sp. Ricciae_BoGa-3]|uniref:nucleotidyltransferase family protein n=1 Tax=Aneurinibacillus sp. Ricciae_BoGa-3 TaxID=3022697 RepID=UPI0023402BEF|nr:nucleotidyltransferase family protein [Aneurinibacillus sp. Ricciae_BoGa-3]WCK53895.1 nucleotidyltransferase family protein [Aneurinibacillus sp. Ricciae_BoGa-3]
MSLLDELRHKKNEILRIAGEYGVSNIRIYGSAARQEETADSDVDLLVDIEKTKSLFDLIAFKNEVESLLGRKVDVGTGIHPYVEKQVMKDIVQL